MNTRIIAFLVMSLCSMVVTLCFSLVGIECFWPPLVMAGIFALVAIVLTFVKKSDSDRKGTDKETDNGSVTKKDFKDLETKLIDLIKQKTNAVGKLSEITNDEWLRATVELQNQNALLREILAVIKYSPEEISESLQSFREIVDKVIASRLKA